MDIRSKERLLRVHPRLAEKIGVIIADFKRAGKDVRVVQALRTFAEQDMLFQQGRSRKGPIVTNARAGQSNHNYGLAVDLCPFVDGQPTWNDTKGFKAIGAAAKAQGLEWGGDWVRMRDMPHVQLNGPAIARCFALFKQGGLVRVWQEADKTK